MISSALKCSHRKFLVLFFPKERLHKVVDISGIEDSLRKASSTHDVLSRTTILICGFLHRLDHQCVLFKAWVLIGVIMGEKGDKCDQNATPRI